MKIFLTILLLSVGLSAQVTARGTVTCKGTCTLDPTVVTVVTSSLPGGTVGIAYSQPLAAVGGSGIYTWTVSGGVLPGGLSLSGNTISGTPTTVATVSFQVTATDSTGSVSGPQPLSIAIVSGIILTINNTSFPNFPFTQPYGQPITVSGGTGTGYVCSAAAGGTGLPAGVTVNTNCAIGIQATAVGGSIGATFTFKLHVVDSGTNNFTSPLFTAMVIQPCGPPNFGCAGRAINPAIAGPDNCKLQLFGGGPSDPCGHPTDTFIPNLNNGQADCTIGVNCTGVSAVDPQFNNVLMTRCTDGSLNGILVPGSATYNRTWEIGLGGSGDGNAFNPDSSMVSVFNTGNQVVIETIDTVNHTCYPITNGSALFLPGQGEFSSKAIPAHQGDYFAFLNGTSYAVQLYHIACTNPGTISVTCTGLTSPTTVADFGTIQPQLTATPWAPSTSYSYGQYVTTYLTNSQHSGVTAATCASNLITYTVTSNTTTNLASVAAGGLVSVTGLSTYNGAAMLVTAANPAGTIVTTAQTCTNGTITVQTGTMTEGSQVMFQNVTPGVHTSGTGTPSWSSLALSSTPDNGITWMDSGTTNFTQGGGWSTIGGASIDETQFSAGASSNNFDTNVKDAAGLAMNGNQNTGFVVWHYDGAAGVGHDVYYEWNVGSGIAKSYKCTHDSTNPHGDTGPQCTRGAAGITVLGGIQPSTTIGNLCSNTDISSPFFGTHICQAHLHNVKIFKGNFGDTVGFFSCSSKSFGPGNCPAGTKYFWQTGTTTAAMCVIGCAGHETEHFRSYVNVSGNQGGLGAIGQIRDAGTQINTGAQFYSQQWINANNVQMDGHWGWYYLNGAVDDTITTPFAGAPFNYQEFPYKEVYEGEVLVVPTCGVLGGATGTFTTPTCNGSELQFGQVAREGHTWATYTAPAFGPQNAITSFSQDGRIVGVSTDYACQFGQTDGGTNGLCGFPWSQNYFYCNGTNMCTISPTSNIQNLVTNPGGFVYQTSVPCVSGSVQPKPFNQTVGGTQADGACVWTNIGINKARGDVVLVWVQ